MAFIIPIASIAHMILQQNKKKREQAIKIAAKKSDKAAKGGKK